MIRLGVIVRWVAAAVVLMGALIGCRSTTPPPETGQPSSVSSWLDPLPSPLDGKTQLVAVTTAGWNSFRARLWRFARDAGEWREVGEAVDAVIGRAGYGWGRGLHGNGAPEGQPGPTKVEGDGKSPAGVFEVGAAYGYAEAQPRVSLPYTQATAMLRCVDDPGSTHYNPIVSSDEVEVDWSSAEHMRREDDLYVLTIVVEHNSQEPVPGSGSCIFFHLWKGPNVGMSGCTAMSMGALEELAEWLKPGEAALVALPEKEYEAMRVPWGLPLEKSR